MSNLELRHQQQQDKTKTKSLWTFPEREAASADPATQIPQHAATCKLLLILTLGALLIESGAANSVL